mmetsp:Transcript_13715/g.58604  ORF Transcript_13715/g.58604 Transcript_13715/m.58604 type:complete len:514 (-) Transcript_13715:391-1932(-)
MDHFEKRRRGGHKVFVRSQGRIPLPRRLVLQVVLLADVPQVPQTVELGVAQRHDIVGILREGFALLRGAARAAVGAAVDATTLGLRRGDRVQSPRLGRALERAAVLAFPPRPVPFAAERQRNSLGELRARGGGHRELRENADAQSIRLRARPAVGGARVRWSTPVGSFRLRRRFFRTLNVVGLSVDTRNDPGRSRRRRDVVAVVEEHRALRQEVSSKRGVAKLQTQKRRRRQVRHPRGLRGVRGNGSSSEGTASPNLLRHSRVTLLVVRVHGIKLRRAVDRHPEAPGFVRRPPRGERRRRRRRLRLRRRRAVQLVRLERRQHSLERPAKRVPAAGTGGERALGIPEKNLQVPERAVERRVHRGGQKRVDIRARVSFHVFRNTRVSFHVFRHSRNLVRRSLFHVVALLVVVVRARDVQRRALRERVQSREQKRDAAAQNDVARLFFAQPEFKVVADAQDGKLTSFPEMIVAEPLARALDPGEDQSARRKCARLEHLLGGDEHRARVRDPGLRQR